MNPPNAKSRPPIGGPTVQPSEFIISATPMIRPRDSGKASLRIAKMHVMVSAEPVPWRTRATMNQGIIGMPRLRQTGGTRPNRKVPPDTTNTPTTRTRRRPNLEQSPPAIGEIPSCTTANDPKTTATCAVSRPSSIASSGKNGAMIAYVLRWQPIKQLGQRQRLAATHDPGHPSCDQRRLGTRIWMQRHASPVYYDLHEEREAEKRQRAPRIAGEAHHRDPPQKRCAPSCWALVIQGQQLLSHSLSHRLVSDVSLTAAYMY